MHSPCSSTPVQMWVKVYLFLNHSRFVTCLVQWKNIEILSFSTILPTTKKCASSPAFSCLPLNINAPGKGVPPNFCLCVASLGAERGVNEARSKKRYIDNIMCSPILNTINSVYLSGKLNIKFKHFSLWQNVPPYLFSQYLVYTCNLYILNKTEVIKSSMVINGINQ